LDNAIVNQDPTLFVVNSDPRFAVLHDDPRWQLFLRKIGKSPEQLAKIDFKVTLPKEWQADATKPASASN
jgi:hypothetical protein